MKTIIPTVGRKVWYYPSTDVHDDDVEMIVHNRDGEKQPLDATVIAVYADDIVNLSIFDVHGHIFCRRNVKLLADGERKPSMGRFATWMPYQVKQAEKAESLAGDMLLGETITISSLPVVGSVRFDPMKPVFKSELMTKRDWEELDSKAQHARCGLIATTPEQVEVALDTITKAGQYDEVMAELSKMGAPEGDTLSERIGWLVANGVKPVSPQPPVDNDHVADGCEKFNTPPSPMAHYSLDALRRAWDAIDMLELSVIMMEDATEFTKEQIHAELNRRGDGAYFAV